MSLKVEDIKNGDLVRYYPHYYWNHNTTQGFIYKKSKRKNFFIIVNARKETKSVHVNRIIKIYSEKEIPKTRIILNKLKKEIEGNDKYSSEQYIKISFKGVDDLVAYILHAKVGTYQLKIDCNLMLKTSVPIKCLTRNTLYAKNNRGINIKVKDLSKIDILDDNDPLVIKYKEDEEDFLKSLPVAGDYWANKKSGVICKIIKVLREGVYKLEFFNYMNNKPIFDISNYEKLTDHSFIDNMENGKYKKVVFSAKIKKLLHRMYNVYSDISHIDISDDIDMVSYLNVNKADKVEYKEYYKSNLRQNTRIGRLLKKMFDHLELPEIEKIVNEYKANYKIDILGEIPLEIVEGDDIKHWYLYSNYEKGGGSLNKSCMRHKNEQKKINLYSNNPDKIKMIIYRTPDGKKLLGRSLLWKLDSPKGKYYMDRVYTVKDHDVNLFKKFATKHKYMTYYLPRKTMRVKVKNSWRSKPWMDTFKSVKDKELSNTYTY